MALACASRRALTSACNRALTRERPQRLVRAFQVRALKEDDKEQQNRQQGLQRQEVSCPSSSACIHAYTRALLVAQTFSANCLLKAPMWHKDNGPVHYAFPLQARIANRPSAAPLAVCTPVRPTHWTLEPTATPFPLHRPPAPPA